MTEIDWANPQAKVSKYFTVHECLWLPQWSRMATEADGLTSEIKANIFALAHKMDLVREQLNAPITVHCWFRPTAYNRLVGGATKSAHLTGQAIDFSLKGNKCDDIRTIIINADLLNKLDMRMENLPRSNWVHLDVRPVGASGNRFFRP